jgi:protease IV
MRFFTRFFAVIGLLTVLLIGGGITAAVMLAPDKPKLGDKVILTFDFERPLTEQVSESPFAGLVGDKPGSVRNIVQALDLASRDSRVVGMVARMGNSSQGLAVTQELRDAISRFRKAGRFTIVHSEGFGEFSNGTQSYYLASAFEELWLQPGGWVATTGLVAEPMTYRGTLDKLGIKPQIEKRYEYKSAAEPFMEKGITPANREMLEGLLGDIYDQMVAGIAAGRSLPVDQVTAAIDRSPLMTGEALTLKMVDKVGYLDEAMAAAHEKAGGENGAVDETDLLKYAALAGADEPKPVSTSPVVAIITGEGAIRRGDAESDPFGQNEDFAASTVAAHFQKAIDDSRVKAILFRVNSPGGSAIGSDVVRREVQRARAAGKPVVISMSDLAASGGYWVAMSADRIVAQPGTLTGSIGVLGGKLDLSGPTQTLGVTVDRVSRGRNAGIWSAQSSYSPSEIERHRAGLDDIYDRFIKGVAEGRRLPLERVQEVAKGRVWTGRQAKERGLVDALGGVDVALDQVRELIGLASGAPLNLVSFPQQKTPVEAALALFSGDTTEVRALFGDPLAEYRPALKAVAPLLQAVGQTEEQALQMPPLGIAGQ